MRGDRGSSGLPRIPIKPVLEALGADNVPDTGRWTAMKCPFHGDSSASASVNTSDSGEFAQMFVCHACGMKGRAEHIVMKVEGCDFQTAYERSANYAGKSPEAVRGKPGARRGMAGGEGNITRTGRYRRVGRGNRGNRGPRNSRG